MSTTSEPNMAVLCLDLSLLYNVVYHGTKITARCPACTAEGADTLGIHLVVYPNGKYACVKYQGDKNHNRHIWKLVGLKRKLDPIEERRWRQCRAQEQIEKRRKTELLRAAKSNRDRLIEQHGWSIASVVSESPQSPSDIVVETCPRRFLGSLFLPDDRLWTGELNSTGQPHNSVHWKTCDEWVSAPQGTPIGPYVSPATWKPAIYSRTNTNVLTSPYVVLDFDGLDGIQPTTPEEKDALVNAGLAFTRWLRDVLHWQLCAILLTGSKGVHVWFRTPPGSVLDSLKTVHREFGIDPKLIGHPAQPCRLPGHPHPKTGNLSRVLWLQKPII